TPKATYFGLGRSENPCPDSELRTQNSELRTQNSELRRAQCCQGEEIDQSVNLATNVSRWSCGAAHYTFVSGHAVGWTCPTDHPRTPLRNSGSRSCAENCGAVKTDLASQAAFFFTPSIQGWTLPLLVSLS